MHRVVRAACGEWRFHHSIKREDVEKIVHNWLQAPDGKKYHFLSMRENNNGASRIFYVYILKDPSKETYDKWFHGVIEDLIKRFGRNRSEPFRCPIGVSWSTSPSITVFRQRRI